MKEETYNQAEFLMTEIRDQQMKLENLQAGKEKAGKVIQLKADGSYLDSIVYEGDLINKIIKVVSDYRKDKIKKLKKEFENLK